MKIVEVHVETNSHVRAAPPSSTTGAEAAAGAGVFDATGAGAGAAGASGFSEAASQDGAVSDSVAIVLWSRKE